VRQVLSPASIRRCRRVEMVSQIPRRRIGPALKQTSLKFRAGFVFPRRSFRQLLYGRAQHRLYELKLDGYRALGLKTEGRTRLYLRNGKDFSARFPSITRAIDALPDETLIDGEVVAVDEKGRPSFSSLQNFDRAPMFYVFDLPTPAGEDLKQRPLDERRKVLRKLTRQLKDPIRFSETFRASAADMIAVVREQGLEGVVAKRRDSHYEPGRRSGGWVKMRVNLRQDFIVGGYMPRGRNFDSILVGYFDGRELKCAGSVRAGFTPASRQALFVPQGGGRYEIGCKTLGDDDRGHSGATGVFACGMVAAGGTPRPPIALQIA
jgi:ATP-dependent DNA ligase